MPNLKSFIAVLLVSASLPMTASTIAGTSDGATFTNPLYAGQSFIVSGNGFLNDFQSSSAGSLTSASPLENQAKSFDHITFSFYSASTSPTPYAVGIGYLFSQAYTGTPAQLSSSSAGLLGIASSDGSAYTFSPTLTLSAGVQYFFYEDAPLQPLSGDSTYTGGVSFASSSSTANFTGPLPSLNFSVNGVPAAPPTITPEPSTLALLCTGILAMAGLMRKRPSSFRAGS